MLFLTYKISVWYNSFKTEYKEEKVMIKIPITDIKDRLEQLAIDELSAAIEIYRDDDRNGVQQLIKKYDKRLLEYENEKERIFDMKQLARKYTNHVICGIDEVGRGPLAGPVVTAAVILRPDEDLLYINDSKKLSSEKREWLYEEIINRAIDYAVGIVNVDRIDEVNILNATYEAMQSAIQQLKIKPDVIFVDAVHIPGVSIKQESIIKGDEKCYSIAAASIIAKVTRDRMMTQYEELFPQYQFSQHKGYGTKDHIEAIKKYGPCELHRRTFIKNFI